MCDGFCLLEGVVFTDCYVAMLKLLSNFFSVAGWDEGVLGMQLGEIARLKVCNVFLFCFFFNYICVIV